MTRRGPIANGFHFSSWDLTLVQSPSVYLYVHTRLARLQPIVLEIMPLIGREPFPLTVTRIACNPTFSPLSYRTIDSHLVSPEKGNRASDASPVACYCLSLLPVLPSNPQKMARTAFFNLRHPEILILLSDRLSLKHNRALDHPFKGIYAGVHRGWIECTRGLGDHRDVVISFSLLGRFQGTIFFVCIICGHLRQIGHSEQSCKADSRIDN